MCGTAIVVLLQIGIGDVEVYGYLVARLEGQSLGYGNGLLKMFYRCRVGVVVVGFHAVADTGDILVLLVVGRFF